MRDVSAGLQEAIALFAVNSMPLSLALIDELYAANATISPWQLLRQDPLVQFPSGPRRRPGRGYMVLTSLVVTEMTITQYAIWCPRHSYGARCLGERQ